MLLLNLDDNPFVNGEEISSGVGAAGDGDFGNHDDSQWPMEFHLFCHRQSCHKKIKSSLLRIAFKEEHFRSRDELLHRQHELEVRANRAEHDLEAIRSKLLFRIFKRVKDLLAPDVKKNDVGEGGED